MTVFRLFSVSPGPRGCDRCGAKRSLMRVGGFSLQMWCRECLENHR